MMKKTKLSELREEQLRLKSELRLKEKVLNEKIEFLEDNFGGMMVNSILPFSAEQRHQVSGVFDKINDFAFKIFPSGNEKTGTLLKTIQMFVSGIVFRYLRKMF